MDLTDKKTIKELLAKYGAKAEKGLGQHFVLSKKALARMVAAAEIKKSDTIVEIGPGLGVLTQELAKAGTKIIAIEKDPMMINILSETLAGYKNIKITQADARNLPIYRFAKSINWKVVANLPYNVATFLIHRWLESKNPPNAMVLMIQKEVAQRICLKPPRMNLLAASVQFYADVEIVDYVPAEAFWPRPKVDSAIIKIVPKKPARPNSRSGGSPQKTREAFFAVAKAGFSQPRKQVIGNLVKKLNIPKEKILLAFKKLDIPELSRAENLSLEQWLSLATFLRFPGQKK